MYAFKTCIIVVSAASILLTFSPNFYVVSTALTILGFGIAGELSLPSTVFYEFCPPSKRFYITLMTLFQGFGAILVSLIAYLVSLFNYTGIYNWRIIVAVGAVVGIISMIFRFFMHETPAFLITQNKQVAADDVLNIISLKNTGEVLGKNESSSSLNPNEFTQEVEETPKEIENISENVARLFKPPLLKVTIVLSLVYFI
jgi:MFS family permease